MPGVTFISVYPYFLLQKQNVYHESKICSVNIGINKSMLRSQELLFSSLLVLRSFCSFPEFSPLTYQPTSQGCPRTLSSLCICLWMIPLFTTMKSLDLPWEATINQLKRPTRGELVE